MRVLPCVSFFTAVAALRQRDGGGIHNVINLLEKILKENEVTSEAEAKTWNTYACWSKDTLTGAQKDISDTIDDKNVASRQAFKFQAEAETAAENAAAASESKKQSEEMLANEEQEHATYMSEKAAEEKELNQMTSVLEGATEAINARTGALLQMDSSKRDELRQVIEAAMMRSSATHSGKQIRSTKAFLQGRTGVGSSDVGVITEFMAQLKKEFASDLKELREDREKRIGEFTTFSVEQKNIIKELAATVASHQKAQAAAEKERAKQLEAFAELSKKATNLQAFFDTTSNQVDLKTSAWTERQNNFEVEHAGVTEALTELSARVETFRKAKHAEGMAFLQTSATSRKNRALRIIHLMQTGATGSSQRSLTKIANRLTDETKSFDFSAVFLAIDDMVSQLEGSIKGKAEDRDACKDDIHNLSEKYNKLVHERAEHDGAIQFELAQADGAEERMKQAEAKTEANQNDLESLNAQREQENSDFEEGVKVDNEAIEGYNVALDILNPMVATLSDDASHEAATAADGVGTSMNAPGAGDTADAYTGNKALAGVVTLIENLKSDSQKDIEAASKEEKAAIKGHAIAFTELSNVVDAQKKIFEEEQSTFTKHSETGAGHQAAREVILSFPAVAESECASEGATGEVCGTYLALEERKAACKELLDHFSDHIDAIEQEIEGLKAAKNTLSGMGQSAQAVADEE